MAESKKLSNTELSLAEKLNRIQVELKAPKDKVNKFGGYNYRSAEGILEALKPLLNKYGVYATLSDSIEEIGGRVYVKATAKVTDVISEKSVESYGFAREAEIKKGMDESQITGSSSSYARKYALNGLFLLDDNKDADTEEYALQGNREPKKAMSTPKASATLICERCGKPIGAVGKFSSSDVAEQTRAKFGKQMCFECGKAVKAAKEAPVTEFIKKEETPELPFPIED